MMSWRVMPLDINTLLVVTVANIVMLAAISPAVMGTRPGRAARLARWSLVVAAGAWVFMILSNLWPASWLERVLATLSITAFSATHWLLFKALGGWLGERRFERSIAVLSVLAPVGYFFLFDSYAWRVGWANFLLAAQLLVVALACFGPKTSLCGSWRYIVASSLVALGILTLGRGWLGAFTDLYPSFLTPHPWNVAAMLMTNLVPAMLNFAILGGWHEEADAAMHRQVITDLLTGLLNRRGWQEAAQRMVATASRHALPLTLLMVDIDFFKKINDTLGHDAGDRALQAMGRLLGESRRGGDVAARIGGEEFCILLPGDGIEAAQCLDQRLRQQLPELASALGHPLNFSSGAASLQPGETLGGLMKRADEAMYVAKSAGRGHLQAAH